MNRTQRGRVGELALALYAIVSSDGQLELFTPVSDEDHVDVTVGRHGALPVPSPDFNRFVYRIHKGEKEVLEFRAYPDREDRFSSFKFHRWSSVRTS